MKTCTKSPEKTQRLTTEMRSAATAIRSVQARLSRLIEREHRAIIGQRDTATILQAGKQVEEALERLGDRFDIAD